MFVVVEGKELNVGVVGTVEPSPSEVIAYARWFLRLPADEIEMLESVRLNYPN